MCALQTNWLWHGLKRESCGSHSACCHPKEYASSLYSPAYRWILDAVVLMHVFSGLRDRVAHLSMYFFFAAHSQHGTFIIIDPDVSFGLFMLECDQRSGDVRVCLDHL